MRLKIFTSVFILMLVGLNSFAQSVLFNFSLSQPLYLYTAPGGGYAFGNNNRGMTAFAERFDVFGADSNVQVMGVHFDFGGHYVSNTNKTIRAKIWTQGNRQPVAGHPSLFYSGFPENVVDSVSASIKQLAIDTTTGGTAMGVNMMFTHATPFLSDSFYVGFELSDYTYNTLNGDTIGLYVTEPGTRSSAPPFYMSGSDTIISGRNMIRTSAGNWVDIAFDPDTVNSYNALTNLGLAVIVNVHYTGIVHITSNNLSFYGAYPNPATNSTNIKLALSSPSDIVIVLTDMMGKTVNTICRNNLSAGEHIIPMVVSNLPAGNYVYTIITDSGDKIASQLTVVK